MSRIKRVRAPVMIALGVLAIGVSSVGYHSAFAHERYRSADGGACAACHGNFNSATSPSGSLFPFGSNHLMHRASAAMNTSCDLCHSENDDFNPYLNFSDSDGFGGNAGSGCLGCHGRDYGGDLGIMGVGLREHHRTVGVSSCGASSCHPNDPNPLPENVSPPYYGSFETKVWDVCNAAPFFGENFTLEKQHNRGLDNDGDNLYDEDDPDCSNSLDCPGDCGGVPDGTVDINDLLFLLANWGGTGVCDIDDADSVGVNDLLLLLGDWGPCD